MSIYSDDSDQVSETSFDCVGCHHTYTVPEPIEDSSEFGFNGSRGVVCDDCARLCPSCDSMFNINSGASHAYHDGDSYCARCTRDEWRVCNHCDDWTHDDDMAYANNIGRICQHCLENYYWWCESCDEYHGDNDECSNHGLINDYSYRPTPIFYHTEEELDNARVKTKIRNNVVRRARQMTYMGFELEVESMSRDKFRDGAELFQDIEDLVYLKTDGSLNNGFEIVSHPMTLDWFMANFPFEKLEELKSLDFEGWNVSSAGLHVHVSKDAFNGIAAEAKFVCLIHNNANLFESLAGRSGSRWSQFDNGNTKDLRRKLLHMVGSDRYSAVNMNNQNTLEVRIFKSSLKPERLQMALQLVDACVAFSNTCNTPDYANAGLFVDWIHENKDRYAVLASYVSHDNGVFTVQEME